MTKKELRKAAHLLAVWGASVRDSHKGTDLPNEKTALAEAELMIELSRKIYAILRDDAKRQRSMRLAT